MFPLQAHTIYRLTLFRQGVFEATKVDLLFEAVSLGSPFAKSQKMGDLGVLTEFVSIAGSFGAVVCRQMLSDVCTLSANKDKLRPFPPGFFSRP